MILDKIKERGEEMAPLEGHDRLQYLIDIAREVPPLDDKDKIDENKIRGCASNLWVVGTINKDNTMTYKHDGESYITKGTAKIIIDPPTKTDKGGFSLTNIHAHSGPNTASVIIIIPTIAEGVFLAPIVINIKPNPN